MKSKIKTIVNFFNQEYPFKNAEEWDKVGHTYGDLEQPLENVVIALDLTKSVFDYAIKTKSQLIITHHPFIFNDDINEDFNQAPYKKDLVDRIENTGISLLALHTNYDVAKHGMQKAVAKKLDLKTVNHNNKYGVMTNNKMTLEQIESLFLNKLKLPFLNSNVSQNKNFKKWAILPGSGSIEDILQMHQNGAELIITSDIKWSDWIVAKELGFDLIEVSHYIENVFTDNINQIIKKHFKNINTYKLDIASYI